MSTDLKKFLCLIGVSLGVFLTTNGQVEAAKSICTKTELYIKRGSVKYAIKESKKPGRETCGLLIIEKFYPKKLPTKKALTLVKNARDFLSRTSPKYSTLLKYVINLDAEPERLCSTGRPKAS